MENTGKIVAIEAATTSAGVEERVAAIKARLATLDEIDAELKAARRRFRSEDWAEVMKAAAARKRLNGGAAVTPVTRAKAKAKAAGINLVATVATKEIPQGVATATSAGVDGGQELKQLVEGAYEEQ